MLLINLNNYDEKDKWEYTLKNPTEIVEIHDRTIANEATSRTSSVSKIRNHSNRTKFFFAFLH